MKIDSAKTFLKISSSLQKMGITETDIKSVFKEQGLVGEVSSSVFGIYDYNELMDFCNNLPLQEEIQPQQDTEILERSGNTLTPNDTDIQP